jgi:predicted RNA polymerase sigma factor
MLLNHARLPVRFDSEGRVVRLDRQDRSLWDTAAEIAEGVRVVQSALARQTDERRPGRYRLSLSRPTPSAAQTLRADGRGGDSSRAVLLDLLGSRSRRLRVLQHEVEQVD